jgi:transposase
MRPRTEIPAAQVGAIRRAMLAAATPSAFQRLQCLWLRAKEDLATETIARMVGLSGSHVRRVWSDYLQGGLPAAQGRPKGGRRHQNLTAAQERSLLQPLQVQAKAGQLVTAHTIKIRYETRVGHAVPDSTVYRLLDRHQWRQIQPRPKHPKDNPQARAAFKKTPGQGGRGRGWTPAPALTADVRG